MDSLTFSFTKAKANGSYIRGFASVASFDGKPVEDWQGDTIDIEVVRKAAHDYIASGRVAKAMHKGEQIGEVVESIVIDDALAKSLGITDKRRGWYIGMAVNDLDARKKIVDGVYKAFSIGGRGVRAPVKES